MATRDVVSGIARRGTWSVAAVAGLIGPVVFATLVIVQGWLQPDYSHVALPISALAAWSHGWIQSVNFLIYACLLAVFASGLHRAVRPSRGGAVGPALLMVTAAGAALAALFPWQRVDGVLVEPPTHVVGAVMHFLGLSLALLLVSIRLARDPAWRSLARYTGVTGAALLALFVGFGFAVLPDGAALHPWAGLVQRVIVAIWMAWIMVAALKMQFRSVSP